MHVIHANSAQHALEQGVDLLLEHGITSDSRNGPVIRSHCPVVTCFHWPRNRVIESATRKCNPFLHLFESLWMLAGREDISFITQFAENFKNYSDDGLTMNGAYGYRWKTYFGYDQLESVIDVLRKDPGTRRAVMSMWDPVKDLRNTQSKDLPCNLQVLFDIQSGHLNMTVTNRSNDMVWGAYGANVVHFSFLMEYVANRLGLEMGRYYQMSNNFHVYPEVKVVNDVMNTPLGADLYDITGMKQSVPLISPDEDAWMFHSDLSRFMHSPLGDWDAGTRFFDQVARPMYRAWFIRDSADPGPIAHHLRRMDSNTDWAYSARSWIQRYRNSNGLDLMGRDDHIW